MMTRFDLLSSAVALLLFAHTANAADFYVAPNGRDAWSGRHADPKPDLTDGPFATLERAREAIRALKSAGLKPESNLVFLRGGSYTLTNTFILTSRDSGSAAAPVIFRNYRDENVVLSGGKRLKGFQRVTDASTLARLSENASGQLWHVDLAKNGVTNFGEVAFAGKRPELFFQDQPMTLARWPNEGFARVASVVGGQPITSHGIKGDAIGKFTFEGEHPKRWAQESDVWLHGYWFWDWADAHQRIKTIDPDPKIIELQPPNHGYGYRAGQRYYALNLLSELDAPGEWYLDREQGKLYFWPSADLEKNEPALSVLPTLISLRDASWITIQGLVLEATRGTAVTLDGGHENRIAACVIRNTGSWAVTINGGSSNGVVGCDIYRTGEGGISLTGGDRKTLTPSGHFAVNNHLFQFGRLFRTYKPAVGVNGVGVRVAHNLIHDGPHNGILLGGNDHAIEFNEIYDVCYETGDVGAFYMGRDWTARGTMIRHNFFHDISGPGLHGAMAVYLDDAASGIAVYGNIFYRAGRAAFIGGGRDNTVENNIFVECNPAVHVDARGLNWMRDHVEGNGTLPTRLAEMPYTQPPWSKRFPQLLSILNDEPGAPKGNVVARNISMGGKWLNLEKAAAPLVKFVDNLADQDPKFADAAALDFRLREDSPAWQLGFKKIPVERIGLYQDESRASWPVAKTRRHLTRN